MIQRLEDRKISAVGDESAHPVSEVIRIERARLRISQAQLAQAAGVGLNRVGEVERGDLTVSVRTLERIASALGMRVTLETAEREDAAA